MMKIKEIKVDSKAFRFEFKIRFKNSRKDCQASRRSHEIHRMEEKWLDMIEHNEF
jgi:hypothetical protein